MVAVQDDGDAIGGSDGTDVVGGGDGTGDGSLLLVVGDTLAGEEGGTTLRDLDDDGRLGVASGLEGGDDGRRRGAVLVCATSGSVRRSLPASNTVERTHEGLEKGEKRSGKGGVSLISSISSATDPRDVKRSTARARRPFARTGNARGWRTVSETRLQVSARPLESESEEDGRGSRERSPST